jgi:hypothetical protein
MQYLVAQTITCLLVAGLLGLLTGWLLWGRVLRRARERVREMEQRVSKLSGYPAKLTDLEGTHAAFVASKNEESARFRARIAELQRLLEVRGPVETDTEPLKARAAAVGSSRFYEATPVAAVEAPRPAPPDPALEFDKRVQASKDAELEKLRTHLAEIEKQPDPDVRRQILLSGKNAELTHLRGILNSLFQPLGHDEIAQRAYSYAQQRGFFGGSPTEDWLRAERDSHFGRLAFAWESTRTGTMF